VHLPPSPPPSLPPSVLPSFSFHMRLIIYILLFPLIYPPTLPPSLPLSLQHASLLLRFLALLLRNSVNAHVFPSGLLVSELLGARDDDLAARAMEVGREGGREKGSGAVRQTRFCFLSVVY